MVKFSIGLVISLILNLFYQDDLIAKEVERNHLKFSIESEKLFSGEIHYFYKKISRQELKSKNPELLKLDFAGILKNKNNEIILGKIAYVVNRPINFFENKELITSGNIFLIPENTYVEEIKENFYRVKSRKNSSNIYDLKIYYDSDDVCSVPNSKTGQAVQALRDLDVISKGASSIMIVEKNSDSSSLPDHLIFNSYIPVRPNKTLIIRYDLSNLNIKNSNAIDPKLFLKKELDLIKKLLGK